MAPTHFDDRSRENAQLAYGIVVTIAGILLTLASFGVVDPIAILRFWPVIFIVAGGVKVMRRGDQPVGGGSWMLIIIGVWLLLHSTGRTHVGFWDLVWPIALVAIGIRLWTDATREQRRVPAEPPTPLGAAASRLTAILAGSTRVVQEAAFPGASMTAVLGNCVLDLHLSGPPAGGEATIEVFALFGAHEIIVPEGWTVVIEAASVGASLDDQRSSFAGRTRVPGDTRPRVIVTGVLMLSGMRIKT